MVSRIKAGTEEGLHTMHQCASARGKTERPWSLLDGSEEKGYSVAAEWHGPPRERSLYIERMGNGVSVPPRSCGVQEKQQSPFEKTTEALGLGGEKAGSLSGWGGGRSIP